MTELPTLLGLAVRAAHRGGAELAARAGRATGVGHKSTPTDPVTDADRASEAAVTELLTAERPGDGLLGEEGAERPSETGLRWVLDPLDGTVNHLYGIPHTAVSVACERLGDDGVWRAVAGVVCDPARGETFTATLGGGARLNGAPVRVNDPVPPPSALVATGFAYGAGSRARQAAVVPGLLPRIRDIRSGGSAALELCWVACGRTDAYYEDELAPWDTAAGALIAAEAGARTTVLPPSGVLAAGPALHAELAALLTG
ncbi:inositol monophosphatase family protein [Streptomyces sp. RFCAC02]|uniref:inositol monophosphatase family protein n=1 Tax=Streptomyces sp. RFCAC02 TaxID=2499143 RepID=UPI0010228BE3|nr:inositol monophosphatase family protein [Streptomyces sp. RFCAC02]